ncbi:MAG: O-sialoglycoprotein endopeptidase [halophilic archaeon J07HX64]|nr:MAG: O-sialoglycoprotein endopeptidase [halophilic archaeon J07HX64]
MTGTESANPRVLGVEGTAWAASAAVYDAESGAVDIETEAYIPDSGGIHPREAAEHMAEHLPEVIERTLASARDTADGESPVDAVAFSRGPGLGPCLRLTATSARALAQRLDVPLVGVNHMVAHLEIGRHRSGFSDPVCLNASGANAHVLGYRGGRYRVLGETMDTGVGNAIDKFTRTVGWSHPGGPKVERAARDGEYLDLPYVVKGMDFSFAGISSAASEAVEAGTPIEDVCCGLQETVFAMLTEVSERALSLTGGDELVLGGGVAQNERLRAMLTSMCEQRGAAFFAPENRFLRDNAGMIAVLGATMYRADDTLAVEESGIDADFRPDEVSVTWRADDDTTPVTGRRDTDRDTEAVLKGAEATVTVREDTVHKRRNPRAYRHPELDERLRRERTRAEARLTAGARRAGVPAPLIHDIDLERTQLSVQTVGDCELRAAVTAPRVQQVARYLARLHGAGLVHGDPTTRNIRVRTDVSDPTGVDEPAVFLIDLGLGYHSEDPEDHAMDLQVFRQSLTGTEAAAEQFVRGAEEAYRETGDPAVLECLRDIESRGRYQWPVADASEQTATAVGRPLRWRAPGWRAPAPRPPSSRRSCCRCGPSGNGQRTSRRARPSCTPRAPGRS